MPVSWNPRAFVSSSLFVLVAGAASSACGSTDPSDLSRAPASGVDHGAPASGDVPRRAPTSLAAVGGGTVWTASSWTDPACAFPRPGTGTTFPDTGPLLNCVIGSASVKSGDTIALDPGVYAVFETIVVDKPGLTFTTNGFAGACDPRGAAPANVPAFISGGLPTQGHDARCADLLASYLMPIGRYLVSVVPSDAQVTTFASLELDGGGYARAYTYGQATGDYTAGSLIGGLQQKGYTIFSDYPSAPAGALTVTKSALVNALSGSALHLGFQSRLTVTNNVFFNNGFGTTSAALHRNAGGVEVDFFGSGAISDNVFAENGDVDVQVGAAPAGTRITGNTITHASTVVSQAMNLGPLSDADRAPLFQGTIDRNVIRCNGVRSFSAFAGSPTGYVGAYGCAVGIGFGEDPVVHTIIPATFAGATVTNNSVDGAGISYLLATAANLTLSLQTTNATPADGTNYASPVVPSNFLCAHFFTRLEAPQFAQADHAVATATVSVSLESANDTINGISTNPPQSGLLSPVDWVDIGIPIGVGYCGLR